MRRPPAPRAALDAIRLTAGVALVGLGLLAVFPAPTYSTWKAAILATEYGHLLALPAVLALLPGGRGTPAGRVAAAVCGIAALLLLSPLARALPVASALPGEMEKAFGPRAGGGRPLSAGGLLTVGRRPPFRRETHAFATRGARTLRLDLYRPAPSARPVPLVVVVHGGSWRGGDRTQLLTLNAWLASKGYAVAAVEYGLAPEHRFPAALQDVRASLAWLRQRAPALGIDAGRIVLLGRSAGGQLALLAAVEGTEPGVRGAVSFYGPTDLRYGWEHPARIIDTRAILRSYLGGSPATAGAAFTAASPALRVGPRTPPVLLVHGGRDELVQERQSERMAAALAAAGRPHLLLRLPWATHGCDAGISGPCGQLSTHAVERFLAAALR